MNDGGTSVTILIENATVIVDPLAGELLEGQAVAVQQDIAAVGPADELSRRFPDADRLNGSGAFLLPGLIDAHTHLYAAMSVGMPTVGEPARNFPQVLDRIWWQFDKILKDDDIYMSGLVGSIASVKNGITTILDHHASPTAVPGSLSHLAAAVQQVGLRACLAYEVSDRDGSTSREQGIAENRRFILKTKSDRDGLLKGLFGLHAVFSLSDETLWRCAEEMADLGVGCHMHMAEHEAEVLKFAGSHDKSIPRFLADVGILGPDTVVAHTVHVNRDDIEVLLATGTFNVHNPRSNMGNGVGIAPVASMIDLGQPVGLGSDGFYDLPHEIAIAKHLQTLDKGDPSAFSDSLALRLVYDHNVRFAARVFERPLGRIVPGYAADLILVDYLPPTPVSKSNLGSHIVAALSGGRIRDVLVNGRIVLRAGQVLGVDEADVSARAKEQAARLWARL
jgi:putative selenium metabolism protein SsnA